MIILAVHPRVCGEHCLFEIRGVEAVGSSPRVRGTSESVKTHGRSYRFIPACAGNMSP